MGVNRDKNRKLVAAIGSMAVWNVKVRVFETTGVFSSFDNIERKSWEQKILLN